ncbi:MAG: TIGR02680 family protein, partial [Actinomycetota bacterium]|nr:TIGR02680 family protein [Actinomycetota bacterium]
REAELENSIDSLKSLPAYQGLRDLQDRERLVERTRDSAGAALDNASVQRNHADRAVETVLTVLRRLGGDVEDAAELARSTSEALVAAGLDPALCPTVPPAPKPLPRTTTATVRAKPDPEAEPLEVQRRTPPEVAPEELEISLAAAARRAEEVGSAVARRAALSMALHERARTLDNDRQELDKLRTKARDAQIEATETAGHRNEARQRFGVAAEMWCEQVVAWTTSGPFAGDHAQRPPQPPTPDEVRAERAATRSALDATRRWATPHVSALRQQVVSARQVVDDLVGRVKDTETRLIELRGGVDVTAPVPQLTAVRRDSTTGAPFYRLVDFASGLDGRAKAGLEAALQASGLLTAWVSADGSIPDFDTMAIVDGSTADHPLSAALVPSVEPESTVSEGVVAALLAAVSYGGDHSGLTVWPDGRWRAGVLHGSTSKQDAEYVGAGAREAARKRAITELAAALETMRDQLTTAESELGKRTGAVDVWDRHLSAFPDDRELIGARVSVEETERRSTESITKADRRRAEHVAAEGRLGAMASELSRDAGEAGLPADTDSLRQAHRAATQARAGAESLRDALAKRCVGTVRDLVEALHDYNAAVADRTTAEQVADEKCVSFHREAAALAELTVAIGGEAEEVARQLTELERTRRAIREELPGDRRATTELSNQVVKTQTLLDTREAELDGKRASADAAARAFGEALSAPGVWAAATDADRPDEDDEAFTLLDSVVAESKRLPGEENVL